MLINLLTNLANTRTVAEEFIKMAKVEDSNVVPSSQEASESSTDSFSSASDEKPSSTDSQPSISNILKSVTGYSLDDISQTASTILNPQTTEAREEPVSALEVENSNIKSSPGMTDKSNNLFTWIAKGFSGLQSFVTDPLGTTVDAVSQIGDSDIYKQALNTVPGLDAFVTGVNDTFVKPMTKTALNAYDYVSNALDLTSTNRDYYEKQAEEKRYEENQYQVKIDAEKLYQEELYERQLEEQRQEAARLEQEAYEKQQLAIAEAEKEAEEQRIQEAYEEELDEQEKSKKEKEAKALADLKLDQRLIDIANSNGIEIDPCCVSNSELLNKLVRVIDEDKLAEVLSLQGRDTSALFNQLMKTGKQANFKVALSQIVTGGNLDTVNILAA